MKCPTDGTTLVMTERTGIEIDYCPTCRGVWLDRGELDKIIERATSRNIRSPYLQEEDDRRDDSDGYRDYDGRSRRRRGGWLGELFD